MTDIGKKSFKNIIDESLSTLTELRFNILLKTGQFRDILLNQLYKLVFQK